MRVANGLTLDFTVQAADTALDNFVGYNSSGELTSFTEIPVDRIGTGANLTEATSSVLTITGGTGALLSAVTIQVKAASGSQGGYLSSTDWTTFNNKLTSSLTSAYIFVGNGSNVATGVPITGDITISNAGLVGIATGVIVNADINATAAIAVSKLAALTASRAITSDGSGFLAVSATTATELGYVSGVTSAIQTQINTANIQIVGIQTAAIVRAATSSENGYAIIWDNTNSQWTLGPVGGGGSVTGPGSSTSTAIVRWNGTGGTSLSNSGVLIDGSDNITGVTSIAIDLAGLKLYDTDSSNLLTVTVGSNLSADRTLTLTPGDASRTVTFSGNPTLDDWFDQSVKAASSPTFVTPIVTSLKLLDNTVTYKVTTSIGSALTADRTLSLVTGDANRTLTINASGTLYVTGGTDVALADGGTGSSLVDPGANTLMGWDDTDNAVKFFTIGNGFTYTHASHTLDVGGTISSDLYFTFSGGGVNFGILGNEATVLVGSDVTGNKNYIKLEGSDSASSDSVRFLIDLENVSSLGTGVIFQDSRSSLKGIEYGATGYVTQLHSLTDKEYVDSLLGAGLLTCDVTINTASILTANSSPVQLVAAPGAGNVIRIVGPVFVKYIYGSAAFATNTNMMILIGSSTVSNILSGVINQTSNQYGNFGSVQWTGSASNLENKAVNFSIQTGDPTSGTGSSVHIVFNYVIETL